MSDEIDLPFPVTGESEPTPAPVAVNRSSWNLLRKVRFSMALVMMMVVAAAAASALFAKVRTHIPTSNMAYLRTDAPILFVASIGLTAVALGALKGHSAAQMMLQTTIACLGFLSLITLGESGLERPLLYWFQVSFGLFVTIPMLARRIVKNEMERGPRRTSWKKTCESIYFAFLTMMLVLLGLLLQFIVGMGIGQVLKF